MFVPLCRLVSTIWSVKHLLVGWLTPLVYLPLLLMEGGGQEAKCAYVVLVMITYWFSEVIPMSITALIPVVLFPLLEVVPSDAIAKAYFNGTVMVFLGSLVAATAIEKSNLHERIALKVILATGTSPNRLLMGFMFTTAFLSTWISNLATVALMVPIVNAALEQLTRRKSISYGACVDFTPAPSAAPDGSPAASPIPTIYLTVDDNARQKRSSLRRNSMHRSSTSLNSIGLPKKAARKLRRGILLGICYAANIGGTGTLTGSSTNLVLNGFLKDSPVSFSDWFFFNLPGLIILIIITWAFLSFFFIRTRKTRVNTKTNEQQVYEVIRIQYNQLGSLTFHEVVVSCLFMLLLFLWFFRSPDFMPGWTGLFTHDVHYIKDQVPAILVVVLFFLIPADPHHLRSSPMLLDWKVTQERISWGVILLLGGGFALAKGCEESGLSQWLGTHLAAMESLSPSTITILMCALSMILTEFTSNTATCTIILPVIYRMTIAMGLNPLMVMLPVTVSCSYAFMLPVASGTNAIIFEVGRMRNKDMFVPGFFLKFICLGVLLVMMKTWGQVIFKFAAPEPSAQL